MCADLRTNLGKILVKIAVTNPINITKTIITDPTLKYRLLVYHFYLK